MEAERDQPVHAAQAQTRDDGRGDENVGSPCLRLGSSPDQDRDNRRWLPDASALPTEVGSPNCSLRQRQYLTLDEAREDVVACSDSASWFSGENGFL